MPPRRRIHTAKSLVARLRALVRRTGRDQMPEHEFVRATGISPHHIGAHFGTYGALRAAAGLRPAVNVKIDNDTLLRRLRDACLKAGRIPPNSHLQRFGASAKQTYYTRWDDWRGTLAALRDWAVTNDPEFPYLPLLTKKADGRRSSGKPEPRYGAPLQIGPLLHEPTNELGVVALFAGLANTLGFGIERLQPGFPDCEAKQRVHGGWRRVRIEFEYQSRNFQRHNHDPAGCDLIVCWEDNWPEAPLEVIELKSRVRGLGASFRAGG